MKIGYENTDKKIEIEIYDLKFEISNVEKLKEYEDIKDDDLNGLEKMIEIVLGEGSVQKINEKRLKDGYKEMDSTIALNMLSEISSIYIKEYANKIIEPIHKAYNEMNKYSVKRQNYNNRGKRYGRY
jgi:hypothetical protein